MSDLRGFSVSDVLTLKVDIARIMDQEGYGNVISRAFWVKRGVDDFSVMSKDILKRRKLTTMARIANKLCRLAYDIQVEQKIFPDNAKRGRVDDEETSKGMVTDDEDVFQVPANKRPVRIRFPDVLDVGESAKVTTFTHLVCVARIVQSRAYITKRMDVLEKELCNVLSSGSNVEVLIKVRKVQKKQEVAKKNLDQFRDFYGKSLLSNKPSLVSKKHQELIEKEFKLRQRCEELAVPVKIALENMQKIREIADEWLKLCSNSFIK
jgi:hypothetical protein